MTPGHAAMMCRGIIRAEQALYAYALSVSIRQSQRKTTRNHTDQEAWKQRKSVEREWNVQEESMRRMSLMK